MEVMVEGRIWIWMEFSEGDTGFRSVRHAAPANCLYRFRVLIDYNVHLDSQSIIFVCNFSRYF